jgi:hypothetical protein
MKETKSQLKERLQAIGQWSNFVAQREELKKEGWSPPDAYDEALLRVESLPPLESEQPIENNPGNPSLVEDLGQSTMVCQDDLDFTRQIPNVDSTQWVAENIANSKICAPDAPSGLAWGLLQWVRQSQANQSTFWSSIWPKFAGAASKQQDPSNDKEEWKGKGECPTCGTWVGDEGTQRVMSLLNEQFAADRIKQANEDAKLAAKPNAEAIRACRQTDLKNALWRERRLREKFAELERAWAENESNQSVIHELMADFHARERARDMELAIVPEPGRIIDSLRKALERTIGREAMWEKELKQGASA